MAKITKATFKSFLRKNEGNLFIHSKSRFDGMYDCCMEQPGGFMKVTAADRHHENNCGINGVWLTHSGNMFDTYDKDGFKGIDVYNCCGHFIIAIKN